MNKIILILCFNLSTLFIFSQKNDYIIKRDTINKRQITEQHIYNSFIVQFDSLIDIYDVFQQNPIYLTNIAFIENNKVLYELHYTPYDTDNKTSVCINYTKDNKLISETYFLIEYSEKDSIERKDGLYKSYYPTKNIKERGYYKKNIKNGKWFYYYNNGEIKAKGEYSGDYFLIRNIRRTTNLFVSKPKLDTLIKKEYPQDLKEYMDTILKANSVFPQIYPKKKGEWQYYDNQGNLIKKEYFNNKGLYRKEFYYEREIIKEKDY